MSNAAPITNADVEALTVGNCIPNGYLYTLVGIFAKHFATFAVLNPSLITALEMMPGCRGRARAAA